MKFVNKIFWKILKRIISALGNIFRRGEKFLGLGYFFQKFLKYKLGNL